VRFEVSTTLTTKTALVYSVRPCREVYRNQSFRRACCLPLKAEKGYNGVICLP